MKKFLALLLVALMVCGAMTTALADIGFDLKLSQNRYFEYWSDWYGLSYGNNWHFTWDTVSDMSNSVRVVVRIMTDEDQNASSLWVYSTRSEAYHPYKTGFGNNNSWVTPTGRIDNRDTGSCRVKGIFHN